MVEITQLAKLLEIPGIDAETAQLINAKLRELIGKVEPPKPKPPLSEAQQQEVITTMAEWIEGVKQGGEG